MTNRLSDRQLSFLAATFRCVRFGETRGLPSVFAVGAQWKTLRSLVRLGLLEFWCEGMDIDGDRGDVQLYRPTQSGVDELLVRGEITQQDFAPAVFYALRGLLKSNED